MDIVIDFDGVITKTDGWPNIGEPNKFIIWAVKKFKQWGHNIILFTSRENLVMPKPLPLLDEAIKWLKEEHDLVFDVVNDNLRDRIIRYGWNCRKVTGDYFIDDRACFNPTVRAFYLCCILNPISGAVIKWLKKIKKK